MKIIITGASGFVGQNFQDYFGKTNEIDKLSLRYATEQNFEINGDAVIHLAGKAHDLKKVSNAEEYYKSNFELTKQIFDKFLISEIKVFIFMSTVKAVADSLEDILTEDFDPNPKTHYGIAKYKAEQYILAKDLPDDKRIYILRPCMIHGPGNKGNLSALYQIVAKRLPWPLGAFENKRSFLSIENLCFVVKEILENEKIPSGVYNISDDKSLSTNELIELLNNSLGKKKNLIWKVNKAFIKSVAKFGDYLHLPLNSERLQKLTENYVVSNKKIISVLGKPLPISAEIGLMKTFESFRNK